MQGELIFDLQPTSLVFHRDHRIRVKITGADNENAETPKTSPASRVMVYREKERVSQIVLAVIPAK